MTAYVTLDEQFGNIDIYLFDQILRRRIAPGDRIVDAGCGFGRNLVYLLREGYDVHGADADPDAVAEVQALAARLAPALPAANFRVEPLEQLSFPERWASVVIISRYYTSPGRRPVRPLAGSCAARLSCMFFCRLASTIGIESEVQRIGDGRRHRLPDGTARYLVDERMLMALTERLGGKLLDPLKTTVVQGQRSMTTWVVRKD